jgi:hypothetical protein
LRYYGCRDAERRAVMQNLRELVAFARGQGYAADELVEMIEDVG